MADPNDLTTLAKVKQALGITDTSQDAFLAELITAATSAIETYACRKFKARTYTNEFYDGPDDPGLVLKNYPLISVADLRLDTDHKFNTDAILVEDTDFITQLEEGMIELITSSLGWGGESVKFPRGAKIIRITYNAGYVIIPADLDRACVQLVAYWKNNELKLGLSSISLGAFSQSFTELGQFPDSVQKLIGVYQYRYSGVV